METLSVGQALRKFVTENRGASTSWLVGNFLLFCGILVIVISLLRFWTLGLTQDLELLVVGLALGAFSWVAKVPFILFKWRMKREHELEDSENRRRNHQKEMDRIRKSMSPAEWELYKVQLENQKLLREIKNKPTAASGSRIVYGLTQDLSD